MTANERENSDEGARRGIIAEAFTLLCRALAFIFRLLDGMLTHGVCRVILCHGMKLAGDFFFPFFFF